MARLEMPAGAAMTPEQQDVCAEVIAGRRGKVPAPMIAWLRNPRVSAARPGHGRVAAL
ncbi:hypothetical protein LP414_08260 [Polaromonas sp. P1(28)-13]|nr:hypothetical protein LP414_08260 [Polaromonas sp. P1(28)-13]